MAKIALSELEVMLVTNSEWILTKHTILQKVSDLLAGQVNAINDHFIKALAGRFPELAGSAPKISKGENYKGLPYRILDHPAVFSATAVFAIRTMFWWGNFFSVTLHLSGKYKKALEAGIAEGLSNAAASFYISSSDEEWAHHFGADNYISVDALEKETLYKKIVQPSFVKVALKYDLDQWNNMDQLLQDAYSRFALILTS